VLGLFDWSSEVLLEIKLGPDGDVLKTRVLHGSDKDVMLDVVHLIIRYHVMRNAIDGDAHCLLDEPIWTETVAIDQWADQGAL
jgi:hypothetical protein